MQVRSMYEPYLTRALNFLDNVIPLVTELQFTSGGPIIAIQVSHPAANKHKFFTIPIIDNRILRLKTNLELLDTMTIPAIRSIFNLYCSV